MDKIEVSGEETVPLDELAPGISGSWLPTRVQWRTARACAREYVSAHVYYQLR
jgi:hypothetical protein